MCRQVGGTGAVLNPAATKSYQGFRTNFPIPHPCLTPASAPHSDGWSMGVLYSELAAVYNALRARAPAPDLAALPIQYPDYAAWQRARLQSGELEPQVSS